MPGFAAPRPDPQATLRLRRGRRRLFFQVVSVAQTAVTGGRLRRGTPAGTGSIMPQKRKRNVTRKLQAVRDCPRSIQGTVPVRIRSIRDCPRSDKAVRPEGTGDPRQPQRDAAELPPSPRLRAARALPHREDAHEGLRFRRGGTGPRRLGRRTGQGLSLSIAFAPASTWCWMRSARTA